MRKQKSCFPSSVMLIGITGTHGSGKDTLAEYLASAYGFANFSTSDELRYESKNRGLSSERPVLHNLAIELRQKFSADELAKRALARAKKSGNQNIAITAIRSVSEIEYLQTMDPAFVMVAIDAPESIRYSRLFGRGRQGDHVTFEEFQEQERVEFDPTDPFAPELKGPMSRADFILINDGSKKIFEKKIDELMREIAP